MSVDETGTRYLGAFCDCGNVALLLSVGTGEGIAPNAVFAVVCAAANGGCGAGRENVAGDLVPFEYRDGKPVPVAS